MNLEKYIIIDLKRLRMRYSKHSEEYKKITKRIDVKREERKNRSSFFKELFEKK